VPQFVLMTSCELGSFSTIIAYHNEEVVNDYFSNVQRRRYNTVKAVYCILLSLISKHDAAKRSDEAMHTSASVLFCLLMPRCIACHDRPVTTQANNAYSRSMPSLFACVLI
jgi:hypothetical protein